jgi:hypothetical protein
MRHRREEIRPGILYQGFDLAFVVSLPRAAKPHDIQHTDRNLSSLNTVGTRCMASGSASTNGPDVAASKFCISRFATASRGRSRRGCVTPRRVRRCRSGRHRLELTR